MNDYYKHILDLLLSKYQDELESDNFQAIYADESQFPNPADLTKVFIACGITPEEILKGFTDTFDPKMFYGVPDITSIRIPDNIKDIPDYGFSNCFDLENIFIPNTVWRIGKDAFFSTDNIDIYYEGSKNKWLTVVIMPDKNEDDIGNVFYYQTDELFKKAIG